MGEGAREMEEVSCGQFYMWCMISRKAGRKRNLGNQKAANCNRHSGNNISGAQNTVKKESVKKRKITLGWVHYSTKEKRSITVLLTSGGGTRKIDVPAGHSTKGDLIAEA